MKMPGKCTGPKYLSFENTREEKLGSHDLVRRVDWQGETLISCRKCSGYARQRVGPKLMNRCRPEQVGAKEHGKMVKRIQILEEGRVPAKEARNWKIEGKKRRITRKKCKRQINGFELEGLMAQKGLWNFAREKRLQERGAIPKEEGDVIREYNAMHEESFLSSWLREDLVEKQERRKKVKEETREEVSRRGKRDGEKGEVETVGVQRRCVLWPSG